MLADPRPASGLQAGSWAPAAHPCAFPGKSTRGCMPSWGIPASEPLAGGAAASRRRLGWDGHADPRPELSEPTRNPRDNPCAHTHSHTHAARRRTEPPETARLSTGRTSFRNSLARVTTNLPGWEKSGGCRTAAVWEDGPAACGGGLGPAAEKSVSETASRAG